MRSLLISTVVPVFFAVGCEVEQVEPTTIGGAVENYCIEQCDHAARCGGDAGTNCITFCESNINTANRDTPECVQVINDAARCWDEAFCEDSCTFPTFGGCEEVL